MSESHSLAREREIEAVAQKGKGENHSERRSISRREGWTSKTNLPMRSRSKHERVSGRKSSPEKSGESWFYFKSRVI